jgi:phage-related protein (TIGR01555 family)
MAKKIITGGRSIVRESRTDGWSNLVTLLGTNADKRTQSQLTWDYHPPEFYEQMYAGGGIPARIVDLVPEEALREWVDWTGIEKNESEEINDRCEELDARGAFLKTWKWARAYGGACLYIVTDTDDPSSPLRVGERVIGLRDLSRWDLRILTTDVEFDFGSPNWGHPRIYYLNVQMGSAYKGYPIHWSRMIRFDGQLVPRRTFIRNNYWHDSILNRLHNTIRNYETANDSVASMLMDFNVDVFKLKNLANLIASGKEQIVRNRIEMVNYVKSVINAIIIDSDQEEYENKSRSVEGVAELLSHQANRLVAETDIPHTKLLGESPDGSNATGNSTSQQWYNFVSAEQKNYALPKLRRLISAIQGGKKIVPKFRSLRILDDMEKADLRLKTAQTDDIYMEKNVVDPTEIATSRFGGDEYSIDTTLDWEGRASGELVPGQQDLPEGEGVEGEGSLGGPEESFHTTGNPASQEGHSPVSVKPSEPETENDVPPRVKGGRDITGRPGGAPNPKKDAEPVETKKQPKEGTGLKELFTTPHDSGLQYEPKHQEIVMKDPQPKDSSFISQTMSEPFRDPRTDPQMKGPGIPNRARTYLPTRGNGVTAPSGFDFEKDAGVKGVAREGLAVDKPEGTAIKNKYDTADPQKIAKSATRRAATIIVRDGDRFLMGKTNEDGRYTLPGGVVEDGESMHQGGVRELAEETGLEAGRLKFLGSRLVESKQGDPTQVSIYEHNLADGAKPTSKKDPDKEVSKWEWFSSKEPLSDEVMGNLKHPNNVALQHMKLLK